MRKSCLVLKCVQLKHDRPLSTPMFRRVFSSSLALISQSGLQPLAALQCTTRHRSIHFYMNLDDPEETERHVLEDLKRINQEKRRDTMEHMHKLLNLSLSYIHKKDYVLARDYALYTHNKTHTLRGSSATFLFFTAKTAAQASRLLADDIEEEIRLKEEGECSGGMSDSKGGPAAASSQFQWRTTSQALAPNPSKVLSLKRVVAKLRSDAERFDGIAQRMYDRPDKAFMRGRKSHARATGWSEDSFHSDESYKDPFGKEWRDRRKRSEQSEHRRWMQQQTASPVSK